MGKEKFTFDKEVFIENYNNLKSSRKMADLYGCDKTTILNFAKKIGYTNTYRASLTDIEKDEVISKYYTHTALQLAEEYNVSKSLIVKTWMNANIKDKKIVYKYTFNADYFETINTPDKAYFLGLLAADGNVYKRDRNQAIIRLSLKSEDKYILDIMREYVGSNKPLRIQTKNVNNILHYYYSLELVSDKMAEDLSKYNIVPRKTYDIVMPELPKHLQSHYIRGYFDGDGSVTVNKGAYHTPSAYKCSICGFKLNLLVMQSILKENDIYTSLQLDKRNYNGLEFGNLNTHSIQETYNFIKYIYQDCKDLYMPRKKHISDCFINCVKEKYNI